MTLRDLRLGIGRPGGPLTQHELGGIVGVTQSHLCAIERGRARPGRKLLARLADAFALPVETVAQATLESTRTPEPIERRRAERRSLYAGFDWKDHRK